MEDRGYDADLVSLEALLLFVIAHTHPVPGNDRETHSGSPLAPARHSSSVLALPPVVRADDSPPVEWAVRSTRGATRHNVGEVKVSGWKNTSV